MFSSEHVYDSLDWREVLYGYTVGIFPMGKGKKYVCWYESSPRAIIDLTRPLNISRSLRQVIRKNKFSIRIDTAFEDVINECASRTETWINKLIVHAYTDLYKHGFAHSVEAWEDGKLAGGLYGVALKGAFFGESMFYKESNASKVCIVELHQILRKNNFKLFDIQMMTPHFQRLGAVGITKEEYLKKLSNAMTFECRFIP